MIRLLHTQTGSDTKRGSEGRADDWKVVVRQLIVDTRKESVAATADFAAPLVQSRFYSSMTLKSFDVRDHALVKECKIVCN